MSSKSMQEYLKRYTSSSSKLQDDTKKKKKKKKQKHKEPLVGGVKILDDDPVWGKNVGEVEEELDDEDDEEGPQVEKDVEVKIIERQEALKRHRPYLSMAGDGSGWVTVKENGDPTGTDSPEQSPVRKPHHDDEATDFHPQQKNHHQEISPYRRNTDNLSPARKVRHDTPDLSPPRKVHNRNTLDLSPPRKSCHGTPPDLSPPRKVHNRDTRDLSPPRKGRHDTPPDLSPPRKVHGHDTLDLSPPRKGRHDSPPDLSPPRKSSRSARDMSPPRKGRYDTPCDSSPQRKVRHDMPDLSPPRKVRHDTSSVLSSKVKVHHDTQGVSVSRSPDLSPPRKRQGTRQRSSPDLSPPRKQHLPEISQGNGLPLKTRMTDGTTAGLRGAKEIREEIERKKRDDSKRLAEMDPLMSGRRADTVYRDKHGRKLKDLDEYLKLQQTGKKQEKKEEKPLEWGKGLVQKREYELKQAELEEEMQQSFARSRDDPKLDKLLKERVRWGDPMAHLVKKDNELSLEDLGASEKMKESGFLIPQEIPPHSWLKRGLNAAPNRYAIKPGRHWDGVDRSNGFEQNLFKTANQKRAHEQEAYLWSVADM